MERQSPSRPTRRQKQNNKKEKNTCKPSDYKPSGEDPPSPDGTTGAACLISLPEFIKVISKSELFEEVQEKQWDHHVQSLKNRGYFKSTVAVCNITAAAAASLPDETKRVAISLSLLISSLSQSLFENQIMSATPELHAVNQQSLKEKVDFTRAMDWGTNLNMQAVFNLILIKAVAAKLPANEMVKTIFIFSDMEYDCCGGKQYETDYMIIQRKFAEAGYPLPGIVFWNLRGGSRSKPVTMYGKNCAMISGFSGMMLRPFLENGKFDSPHETMLDTFGQHYGPMEVVD